MARKKEVLKPVETITVFLTKPGRQEPALKPGMSRPQEGFQDTLGIKVDDPNIDQNRIGMRWGVGIPKKVSVTMPGSDGQLVIANHNLPEMEQQFFFKIGSPTVMSSVPAEIVAQLEVFQSEGQIILSFGEMEVPGVEEVEDEVPSEGSEDAGAEG